jgi:hypothetical protein
VTADLLTRHKKFLVAALKAAPWTSNEFVIEEVGKTCGHKKPEVSLDIARILERDYDFIRKTPKYENASPENLGRHVEIPDLRGTVAILTDKGRETARQIRDDRYKVIWKVAAFVWTVMVLPSLIYLTNQMANRKIERLEKEKQSATQPTKPAAPTSAPTTRGTP